MRIATLIDTWWDRALASEKALDRVLKLLERRARLLGLDEQAETSACDFAARVAQFYEQVKNAEQRLH